MNESINLLQQVEELLLKNYFEMFALPVEFNIDKKQLKQNMLALQKIYHPDNHHQGSEDILEKILLLSSTLNMAYQVLLNPSSRAVYLLKLLNIKIADDDIMVRNNEILIKQMELRQRIDQAFIDYNTLALDQLEQEISINITKVEEKINDLFHLKKYDEIEEEIHLMLFYQKAIDMISYHE
jgi:molecular chaperone HscB